MSTNRQVITSAMRMLSILDADETASSEDVAVGLEQLNDLMAALAADDIDLGFPPQESVSDEFPLDSTVEAQVKPLLAVKLIAMFPGAKPAITLAADADRARSQLARAAVLSIREEAQAAVPLGSARGDYYDIQRGS
jgi:hypothetical protein